MAIEQDTSQISLNWDAQAVWVQDRLMYLLVDGQDPAAETLKVQDQMGNEKKMTRTELLARHVPVMNATVYKPHYTPIQAFCPREDAVIETENKSFTVKSGDALIREPNGNIRVVARHEFNCRYQFVSAAGNSASFP